MGTKTSREIKVNYMLIHIKNIAGSGEKVDKPKLLAKFAYDMMSSVRTGREIIKILINSGKIDKNVFL